jgi:hypothetical protein
LINNSKTGWNKDEFVHASLILTNYHMLATIAESLHFQIIDKPQVENSSSIFNESNQQIGSEGREKLYNNLVQMNEEGDGETVQKKNFTGDDVQISYEKLDVSFNAKFEKYISNYCTIYVDFDNYSDPKLNSFFVKFL